MPGFNLSERGIGSGREGDAGAHAGDGYRANVFESLNNANGEPKSGYAGVETIGESSGGILFAGSGAGVGRPDIFVTKVRAGSHTVMDMESKPSVASWMGNACIDDTITGRVDFYASTPTAPVCGESGTSGNTTVGANASGKVFEPNSMAGTIQGPWTPEHRTGPRTGAESSTLPDKTLEKMLGQMAEVQSTGSHRQAGYGTSDIKGAAPSLVASVGAVVTPATRSGDKTAEVTIDNNENRQFASSNGINANAGPFTVLGDQESSLNQFLQGQAGQGKSWSAIASKEQTSTAHDGRVSSTGNDMSSETLLLDGQMLISALRDRATEEGTAVKDPVGTAKSFQSAIVNQVVRNAAVTLKNGQSEFRVNLQPEHLGSLQVRVITELNQVTVRIIAESALVKEALDNNMDLLRASLESQGLDVDKLEVTVSHDRPQQREQKETASGFADLLEENEDEMVETKKEGSVSPWMTAAHDQLGSNRISCFA